MTSTLPAPALDPLDGASIKQHLQVATDQLIASLPDTNRLSAEERRGMIGRYSAVLEGNFIYWMTGAYLAVKSEEARAKIMENLREEVGDCHPGMLRKFSIAAKAVPTEADADAVYQDLSKVRLFIGRLQGVPTVVTMAFFEGFIQRFMAYLADLAQRQGSSEMVYTDVHGICDVAHTAELFRALESEMALNPPDPSINIFEGVDLLGGLLRTIISPESAVAAA